MTAKLVTNLSIEDYHKNTAALSKSMLSYFADCPAKFYWKYRNGGSTVDKDHLNVGNAVHTLALEPDLFDKRFYVLPRTYINDKGKEVKLIRRGDGAEYQKQIFFARGRKIIVADDYDNIKGMAEALKRNKKAYGLLKEAGKIEATIFWKDEQTGLDLKCRPDLIRNDGLIVNIKTTHSAEPNRFFKTAWDFDYHLSAALESLGYQALTGKMPENYVFLTIETEEPWVVECFESFSPMDKDDSAALSYFDVGKYNLEKILADYLECNRTGNWPSYQKGIGVMKAPGYAIKQMSQ